MNKGNTMSERYNPWDESYVAAILETDKTKLPKCIELANAIIASRIEELRQGNGGTLKEQKAIADPISALKILERKRDLARTQAARPNRTRTERNNCVGVSLGTTSRTPSEKANCLI